ncbi:MAG: anthranilate phosphoribosyltransferase [Deltaproteobacteria bacterium]|nr:anthranilate phosphoribosyltransferase [Deltaproteobacteria bacterium]
MIKDSLSKAVKGMDLGEAEMIGVMDEIMSGGASAAQIGAFITALRMKGETVAEITGAARVMRERATRIEAKGDNVIDTCGTGGDESMTFNISTAAAFVAAGAGLVVAKHGNRSISSRCGSADVLRALGVNVEAEVSLVEECIRDAGMGFLFAPMLHGAMKYAAPVRRELGIRTIFNLLGPLTNPAGAKRQLIGVYDPLLTDLLAKALYNLGSRRAFVVRGEDGLDEITLVAETRVTEIDNDSIRTYHIKPEDYGFARCAPEELKGGDAGCNAGIIQDVLRGKHGPAMDVVMLNAAAAITVGGLSRSIEEGIAHARASIESGAALAKIEKLKEITNRRRTQP